MTNTFPIMNLIGKFDAMKLARDAAKHHQPTPQRKPVARVIAKPTNADEARELRLQLVDRRNPHETLDDLHEQQFTLTEQITDLEAILADNPTEQEHRDIEGFRQKVLPSLPGIADTFVHVPGSLERAKQKLAQVERDLPRLQAMVADYDAVVEAVKEWPWSRINHERNKENERRLISKGRVIQKRAAPQVRPHSVEFMPR